MPERTSYRPSSVIEAIAFNDRWCSRCAKADETSTCDIFALANLFGVDEPEYPTELRYGADGKPQCTAFEASKVTP